MITSSSYKWDFEKVFMDSIRGLNNEIGRRRNELNWIKWFFEKGQDTWRIPRSYKSKVNRALLINKEIIKLKIIRDQLWILVLQNETRELIEQL